MENKYNTVKKVIDAIGSRGNTTQDPIFFIFNNKENIPEDKIPDILGYYGIDGEDYEKRLEELENKNIKEKKSEENSKQIQFEEYKNKIEEYFNGEFSGYKGNEFELKIKQCDYMCRPEISLHRKFLSGTFLEKLNKVLESIDITLSYIIDSKTDLTIF